MNANKAQGTIEYLVIIAIVIVIALVVVGLLLQIMGQSGGVSDNAAKAAWKTGTPWSVDWTRNGNAMTLSFKNISADTLSLNGIALGTATGDKNLTAGLSNIPPNGTGVVVIGSMATSCTSGSRYSFLKTTPIYIDYNSPTINNVRQYATADIVGTC